MVTTACMFLSRRRECELAKFCCRRFAPMSALAGQSATDSSWLPARRFMRCMSKRKGRISRDLAARHFFAEGLCLSAHGDSREVRLEKPLIAHPVGAGTGPRPAGIAHRPDAEAMQGAGVDVQFGRDA